MVINAEDCTAQEKMLIQKLRTESALYRGYPLGLILGGSTLWGLAKKAPKMSPILKWSMVFGAGIAGNLFGRLSYMPIARKRLIDELPENSQVRILLTQTYQNLPGYNANSHTVKQDPEDNSPPNVTVTYGEGEDKKTFLSYSDLREANRAQKFRNPPSLESNKTKTEIREFEGVKENEKPNELPKIRYNKYGDPIIE